MKFSICHYLLHMISQVGVAQAKLAEKLRVVTCCFFHRRQVKASTIPCTLSSKQRRVKLASAREDSMPPEQLLQHNYRFMMQASAPASMQKLLRCKCVLTFSREIWREMKDITGYEHGYKLRLVGYGHSHSTYSIMKHSL